MARKRAKKPSPSGKSGKGRKKGPRQAELADRHDLYQQAVQCPEADVEFFTRTFQAVRGRLPLAMREDFCGTAYLATTWCASRPDRTAVGVDLDGETLDWGRAHNLEPAGEDVASRVHLVEGDVRSAQVDKVDVTCALNFSYCVFKTRSELLGYFKAACDGLVEDGLFVMELYGGTEAIELVEDERECDGFDYVWDQDAFNPINRHTLCHIHFRFPDGSVLREAFTYDWRLWTIPELRELLAEAGFARSIVYWEDVDEDGDGNGEFFATEEVEQQESWLCYIVGVK